MSEYTCSRKMASDSRAAPLSCVGEEEMHKSSALVHVDTSPPSAPSLSSSPSSRDPRSVPSTTHTSPHLLPSASQAPPCPPDDWDINTTFPEYCWLWPSEPNGTWLASTIQQPSSAISGIDVPKIRNAVSDVGDAITDRLTHAFDGKDLPAMHDRAVAYLTPSMSMPSLRDMSRSVDRVTDRAQEMWERGRWRQQVQIPRRERSSNTNRSNFSVGSSSAFATVDEEEETATLDCGTNQFTFAETMSAKARRVLVEQGICTQQQTVRTYATLPWQKRLESALTLLFLFATDAGDYDAETLSAMTPVWSTDVDTKVWRLQLDTGLVDIVAGEDGDCIRLDVDIALCEHQGSMKFVEMKREVQEEEE